MKFRIAFFALVYLCTAACAQHRAGPAEQIGRGLDELAAGVSDYSDKEAERERERARYRYERDPYYYDYRD